MTSLTPVGDWLRKRYPPNDGATHWIGNDGDPGCCAGPHPMCTYGAAFREGAAAEREQAGGALTGPCADLLCAIREALTFDSWPGPGAVGYVLGAVITACAVVASGEPPELAAKAIREVRESAGA